LIFMATKNAAYHTVISSLKTGFRKGWDGYVWMLKIIVPISFLTLLIDYSGWINKIDFVLKPVMGLLGLPSSAVLPLLAGLLTGIYGTIAAMAVMTFSTTQMTLIAVFTLISHNLIQEGVVQGKSGLNPLVSTVTRLTSSVIMVILLARLLGAQALDESAAVVVYTQPQPFMVMFRTWILETVNICAKIFLIILALMIILETLKGFDLTERIASALRPLLILMGLGQRVGIMWLTACLFGLSFGAAVIVEEAREGNYTPAELAGLQLSIGINHSMIDDPLLFLAFGLNPLFLWIPRLIAAIIAVRVYMFFSHFHLKIANPK